MSIRPRRRKPELPAPAQTEDQPPLRTRDPFAIRPSAPRTERTLADAAALPNPRHELFAQGIAIGLPRDEAYERAGYSGSNPYAGATQLLVRPDVNNRISTLQSIGAKQAVTTIETLVGELEEARLIAKAKENPAAMVSATSEKAVLLGLRVEKRDIVARNGDPKGLTDDELALIARGGGDGADKTASDPKRSKPMVH
jgi:hypothetical protein